MSKAIQVVLELPTAGSKIPDTPSDVLMLLDIYRREAEVLNSDEDFIDSYAMSLLQSIQPNWRAIIDTDKDVANKGRRDVHIQTFQSAYEITPALDGCTPFMARILWDQMGGTNTNKKAKRRGCPRRFSKEQIFEMHKLHEEGASQVSIARQFHVHVGTVSHILHGRMYPDYYRDWVQQKREAKVAV